MGTLAEALSSVRIREVSEDDQFVLTMTGRSGMALQFKQGSFSQYDESELARQLTDIVGKAWKRWQQASREVCSSFGVTVSDGDEVALERSQRELLKQQRDIAAWGASSNECVEVITIGLREWQVMIHPGSLRKMTPESFASEFFNAMGAAMQDNSRQLRELARTVKAL